MTQSKTKKILQLITSNDLENNKLGYLSIVKILTKQNAIYWFITLNNPLCKNELPAVLENRFSELLPWLSLRNPAVQANIQNMTDHIIQTKHVEAKSIITFIDFYNDYYVALLSNNCTKETKKLLIEKNKNNYEFTRELD
jgi:hypothetical protein